MADNVYEELARHLDEAYAGAPMSDTLLEILHILYPGEEAEVACRLGFYENVTLARCEELLPEKAGRLGELLDSMAHRGTVFTQRKPGSERVYRLLPSVVGYVEAPFLSGVDRPETRALAPLWKKYLTEEFGLELARGAPLIRVIPISESLEDESEVLPFDALKEKLDEASFMAVGHCPCRQIGKFTGEGCDRPTERCMHFGGLGRYFVEMGMARRIEKEEALEILRSATEEGLVHVCDNVEGSLRTICNCCPCCCAFLTTMKLGFDSLARSSYLATVSAEDCVGCGSCEDRCPAGAVVVSDDDIAVVDETLCLGCGVCTPWCATETMALVRRPEPKAPPEVAEFVTARLK